MPQETSTCVNMNVKWSNQCWTCFSALIPFFIVGIHQSWTSVYVPLLMNGTTELHISSNDGAWIAMSLNLGGLIGCVISSIIIDKIGRKVTMLVTSLPYLLSCVLLGYGNSLLVLCLGRIVAGIATGMTYTTTPLYLGEIAHPKIRGSLTTFMYIFNVSGFLFINVIGPYLSIELSSVVLAGITLFFVVMFLWMPETPYYYIMKNNLDQARNSLRRLSSDVDEDFDRIKEAVKLQSGQFKDLFTIKSNRNALLIFFVVLNGKQLAGDGPLDAYARPIFEQMCDYASPTTVAFIYYATKLVVVIISSFFIDKFGRRPVLLVSFFMTGLTFLLVGAYLHVKLHTSIDLHYFKYASSVILFALAIFYSLLAAIPGVLLSELFPMNVKSFASLLYGVYFFLTTTADVKFFQVTTDSFGMDVPFFTYCAFCFLHFVLIYIFVFETKRKSLEEIQDHLQGLGK